MSTADEWIRKMHWEMRNSCNFGPNKLLCNTKFIHQEMATNGSTIHIILDSGLNISLPAVLLLVQSVMNTCVCIFRYSGLLVPLSRSDNL